MISAAERKTVAADSVRGCRSWWCLRGRSRISLTIRLRINRRFCGSSKTTGNLGQIGNGSTDAIAGSLNNMFDFNDGPQAHRLLLDPQSGQRLED